jgi:hypothetical protein
MQTLFQRPLSCTFDVGVRLQSLINGDTVSLVLFSLGLMKRQSYITKRHFELLALRNSYREKSWFIINCEEYKKVAESSFLNYPIICLGVRGFNSQFTGILNVREG